MFLFRFDVQTRSMDRSICLVFARCQVANDGNSKSTAGTNVLEAKNCLFSYCLAQPESFTNVESSWKRNRVWDFLSTLPYLVLLCLEMLNQKCQLDHQSSTKEKTFSMCVFITVCIRSIIIYQFYFLLFFSFGLHFLESWLQPIILVLQFRHQTWEKSSLD